MPYISNKNIALIEDHHETFRIWKARGFKNLPLIHIDAHIDFAFIEIKEPRDIIKEAKTLTELKSQLEKKILFDRYGFQKEHLIHIGNYIYPAMQEGIVKEFYWVIPGRLKQFDWSLKTIKRILQGLSRYDPYPQEKPIIKDGLIQGGLFNRKFIVCTLEKLPLLKEKVLLDIDTDFLVIDSLKDVEPIKMIGKRKPWIQPHELAEVVKKRTKKPEFITIAYSVNGGFTPLAFKFLGDELAWQLTGKDKNRYQRSLQASRAFQIFNLCWKTKDKKQAVKYYHKATDIDSTYRCSDNNYGPLYLRAKKTSQAEKEFHKIISVDPKNPYALAGLGNVYLQRQNLLLAKKYFLRALRVSPDLSLGLFGLAQTEFRLRRLTQAKKFFLLYQKKEPMQPQSHSFLARIYEKQKNFTQAIFQYKEAIKLGLDSPDICLKLLKISKRVKQKDEFVDYIADKYKKP